MHDCHDGRLTGVADFSGMSTSGCWNHSPTAHCLWDPTSPLLLATLSKSMSVCGRDEENENEMFGHLSNVHEDTFAKRPQGKADVV